MAKGSLRAYMSVRGAGARDAARLYLGYGVSLTKKLLRPGAYSCVGACLPGSSFLTVSAEGMMVRVRPGTNDLDIVVHHEPRTRDWFKVTPGDVVVDVGAHIGLYTLLAAREASIAIAVEPDPENFALLLQNIRLNGFGNVRAIQAAAGSRSGSTILFAASGTNRGLSSLHAQAAGIRSPIVSSHQVVVRCETLDAMLEPFAIPRVDWLKVDVEGHEEEVLSGASETLAKTRHLILEVTAGHEDRCSQAVEDSGLHNVGGEPGFPASNWFFDRGSEVT